MTGHHNAMWARCTPSLHEICLISGPAAGLVVEWAFSLVWIAHYSYLQVRALRLYFVHTDKAPLILPDWSLSHAICSHCIFMYPSIPFHTYSDTHTHTLEVWKYLNSKTHSVLVNSMMLMEQQRENLTARALQHPRAHQEFSCSSSPKKEVKHAFI